MVRVQPLRDGLYVTQYKRLAAAVAHLIVFPMLKDTGKSFTEGQKNLKLLYFTEKSIKSPIFS